MANLVKSVIRPSLRYDQACARRNIRDSLVAANYSDLMNELRAAIERRDFFRALCVLELIEAESK